MGTSEKQQTSQEQQAAMFAQPRDEHRWLRKFIGEWTYEMEVNEPGKAPERFPGTEKVHAVGEIWIVGEAHGSTPGGSNEASVLTLGYDPQKGHYVGTWIGAPMTHLWVYRGSLQGNVLTLESEGPDFERPGKTRMFRDVHEFKNDDHRTLTAFMQGDDGQWQPLMGMATHYRRKR